jgi:hypothetical protein
MLKIRIWQVFDRRLSRRFGTWVRNLHRALPERRLVQRLNPGSVGGFQKIRKPIRETGLAGWGGRIRTSGWRNQNPTISLLVSTGIPKNPRNSLLLRSIGYPAIRNATVDGLPPKRAAPVGLIENTMRQLSSVTQSVRERQLFHRRRSHLKKGGER